MHYATYGLARVLFAPGSPTIRCFVHVQYMHFCSFVWNHSGVIDAPPQVCVPVASLNHSQTVTCSVARCVVVRPCHTARPERYTAQAVHDQRREDNQAGDCPDDALLGFVQREHSIKQRSHADGAKPARKQRIAQQRKLTNAAIQQQHGGQAPQQQDSYPPG